MSNSNPSHEILLAEDEEHIAKLIAFKLGREGFPVTVARNGQEAIDLFGAKPWGLIILDVMMPIRDGWQVLRALRSEPSYLSIPVLMLTAKGSQKDAATSAELGASRYLRKPFDPDDLARTVRELTGA